MACKPHKVKVKLLAALRPAPSLGTEPCLPHLWPCRLPSLGNAKPMRTPALPGAYGQPSSKPPQPLADPSPHSNVAHSLFKALRT